MTDVKVFKNDQIGGNVTMITTERAKIIIDYGEDLPGNEAHENFSIDWKNEKVDAVFFTHYHGDHIGRIAEIPKKIPLYMSEVTHMICTNLYKKKGNDACLKRLENLRHIRFLHDGEIVKVKDLSVTPYEVDHSAFGAFMFFIETPDKNILHTGDYRDQGRKGKITVRRKEIPAIVHTIEHEVKKKGKRSIDVLLTEGTMIGSNPEAHKYTEREMEADLTKLFRKHKYIFLVISACNADSVLSFYRAAVANGMRFYANEYVLDQLMVFGEFSKGSEDPYNYNLSWPLLKKNESGYVSEKYKRGIAGQRKHMRNDGFVAVVTEKDEALLDEFADLSPMLIYSMWGGYIDEELGGEAYSPDLADFCKRHDAVHVHVGGHAHPDLIASVIETAAPNEAIIPMHTENPERFFDLPISEELKGRIRI